MDIAITVLAVLFVLLVVAGTYATVKAVKAAKRGVDRTITQARRTVEDTALRARTYGRLGPAGELAQLRLRLRTSMRATQETIAAGSAEDASLSEADGLFQRLSTHGHDLDDELKRLEQDPDRAQLAQRLPDLRERTEQITQAAESLRWAIRDRARRFSDDDLTDLGDQIRMEAGALRHWTTEPAPDRADRPAAWPEPERTEGGSAAQTWPDQAAATAEEPTRMAIDPVDPRPAYPWQKQGQEQKPEEEPQREQR